MARVGRKRKANAAREPNGDVRRRPAPERAEDVVAIARAAPHRQILDAKGKVPDPRDPRLGSELGRLRIMGLITSEQYAAGQRWGRIVIRMCRAIAAPPGAPTGVLASLACTPSTGAEMSPEDVLEARQAYDEAHRALTIDLGLGDRRILPNLLRRVIIEDRPCDDLVRIRGALDVLARYFEATEVRRCSTLSSHGLADAIRSGLPTCET